MRQFIGIYLSFFSLFLFSCKEESRDGELESTNFESKYKNLEDFEWLFDYQNFHDKSYNEKYNQLVEKNLKEKNFEHVAAYKIAYGAASKQNQFFDSVYVKTVIDLVDTNGEEISGEAKSNLFHYLGTQFRNKPDLKESSNYFEKSLQFQPESTTHYQTIGLSHLLLAQNYISMRELYQAELNLVEALRIFEEIGDRENQGKVYLLMHILYVRNSSFDKAEDLLQKSIKIFEEEKSEFYALTAHITSVHFHLEKLDTPTAVRQIDQMSKFAEGYKGITDYHKGFLNQFLTIKYIVKNNEDSASYFLNKSKDISERNEIPDLKVHTFYVEIFFVNRFNKKLENPEEVENLFHILAKNETQNVQNRVQLANALYYYYKERSDFFKANQFAEFLIRDTYKQSEDRIKNQFFELETKYQTERKEKTILLQEKKLEEKNKLIVSLVISSAFIVLIFIILFIWTKNKNIIKEKNITEKYAAQLLEKTENERKRIASDLHDSVSNELVNLRHFLENKDNQLKTKIDNILEEVRNISRNISPTLFDKIGLKLSVEQLTERIQNQHDFFISSEIVYKEGLNPEKELQLYRIIQEAITNILKHADAVAGKVTIKETKNNVSVEIRDNGKGFDVAKMLEKGNCFGLLNITERTKYLRGTVKFHSDSSGTIVKLNIPK